MTEGEVVVIGAGIAGLTFARQAARSGAAVTVLEKGRGVGGRCATRRVAQQPVDHGVPTIHGQSELFRLELEQFRAAERCTPVPDWPFRLRGSGTPCRPVGYDSRSFRLAVGEGLTQLPKYLGEELDIRLETTVEAIALGAGGQSVTVRCVGGTELDASTLVVTCPAPQTLALLRPLAADSVELHGVLQLMSSQLFVLPSLTVIGLYERPSATGWHLLLPGPASPAHSVINDSSKRGGQDVRQALVIQGSPRFSRDHREEDPASWTAQLLGAAARELGGWAGEPDVTESHRWQHARLQLGCELARPILLRWPGGATLGLCGEAFDPAGGLEGAYLSALALTRRIAAGDQTPSSPPA